MEHRYINSERGMVHYWIQRPSAENSPCIVFTHGLTADHAMFEKQTVYFSERYTVITWDVPMHGLSRPYRDLSYRNIAEELKTILDTEKIGKAVLVGMSMGGYPSQEFAARYPERVSGMIALDTTPYGLKYYSRSDRWWLKQVGPIARWFPDRLLRKSMAKSVSRTKYAYDMMLKMLAPCSKTEIIEQMELAYGGFLRENRDVRFSFPVLILLGEYDRTGKVRQYCEAWSRQEGYPLHIIRGAAHFSNADNPEDVNREIGAFLREHIEEVL